MHMLDRFRTLLLLVAVALAVTGYSYIGLDRTLGPEELSSSRFQRLLWDSRVVSAQIEPHSLRDIYSIKGEFKRSSGGKSEFKVTAHLSEWDLQKVLSLSRAQLNLPQTGTSNRFW